MAMKDGYRFIFQMNDKAGHDELSLYILVNKQYVEDIPQFTQKITDYVSEAMTNH